MGVAIFLRDDPAAVVAGIEYIAAVAADLQAASKLVA